MLFLKKKIFKKIFILCFVDQFLTGKNHFRKQHGGLILAVPFRSSVVSALVISANFGEGEGG